MPSNPIRATVSSAGVSRVINLDWMAGGPTSILLSAGSTTSQATGVLQFTVQDTLTTPSTGLTWTSLSSNFSTFGSTVAGYVIQSSGLADAPFFARIDSPIGGLRLSCTSFTTTGFIMDVMQGR